MPPPPPRPQKHAQTRNCYFIELPSLPTPPSRHYDPIIYCMFCTSLLFSTGHYILIFVMFLRLLLCVGNPDKYYFFYRCPFRLSQIDVFIFVCTESRAEHRIYLSICFFFHVVAATALRIGPLIEVRFKH